MDINTLRKFMAERDTFSILETVNVHTGERKVLKEFDYVIEAVRYKNGQILNVRAYERRGAAFSDRILLDRKTILDQIKNKKKFVTGQRKEYMAGSFDVAHQVNVLERDDHQVISTKSEAAHDELEGVPVF